MHYGLHTTHSPGLGRPSVVDTPNRVVRRTVRRAGRYFVFILSWLLALSQGLLVAVYCSDVSGAFDRVKRSRIIEKLRALRIHPTLVKLLTSWLDHRRAHGVVSGEQSEEMRLEDMIFQGTVWGPSLWNIFSTTPLHLL